MREEGVIKAYHIAHRLALVDSVKRGERVGTEHLLATAEELAVCLVVNGGKVVDVKRLRFIKEEGSKQISNFLDICFECIVDIFLFQHVANQILFRAIFVQDY